MTPAAATPAEAAAEAAAVAAEEAREHAVEGAVEGAVEAQAGVELDAATAALEAGVASLCEMGFALGAANAAMRRAGMDVARAAEDLAEGLAQRQGTPPQKQEPASMLQLPPGRASHVADMD